ncbi:MAG: phosphotransferase [Lachnospiraceae bacterium]|nr:phosphotransferase [Lachnospiraceae bacterium]
MSIGEILKQEYEIDVQSIEQMTTGVGGDTFKVQAPDGKFIIKIADANEMNHPETEPEVCEHLLKKGLAVSKFLKNKTGSYVTLYDEKRICHIQRFVEGNVFSANAVPDWFMEQSPLLLGRIHNALQDFKQLPVGIGKDFFKYMTPQNAKQSYINSYEAAKERGEDRILEDLEFRINFTEKIADWNFDVDKLTCLNSHGDYTVNQIICGDNQINAVIDWTSACVHPAIWEITRSFYLSEPTCVNGELNETKFKKYVDRYCSEVALTQYDKDNLLSLYYYQLGVCDYYAQYLSAEEGKKEEYLSQARFATRVLMNCGA